MVPGGAAQAADPCLSPEEMREAIATMQVVPPLAAIRAARQGAARAEILRAKLCPAEMGMAYAITLLDEQGRVVQVTIDAASGKVVSRR